MPFFTRCRLEFAPVAARPDLRLSPPSHIRPEVRRAVPASSYGSPADNLVTSKMHGHGDLNNVHAARDAADLIVDPAYGLRSLAIRAPDDDKSVRDRYRPFLISESSSDDTVDWVAQLELSTTLKLVETKILGEGLDRLRILVLYGSLRSR